MRGLAVLVAAAFASPLLGAAAPARADGDDFRATPPPPAARPSTFRPPKIEEARLANGVRVLVVERHELPIVAVRIVSDVGAASAPAGVARFAARLARKSRPDASFLEGPRELSSRARVDAFVGYDSTTVSARVLSTQLENAVDFAGDVALKAVFRPLAFEELRKRRADERKRDWSDTVELAYGVMYPQGHPLHDGFWGSESDLGAITLPAMEAYWRRAFSQGHVTAVLVGDVTLARATEVVEKAFGALPSPPGGAAPPLPPTPTVSAALVPGRGPRSIVVYEGETPELAKVVVVGPGPTRTAADFDAMLVLCHALGGSANWSVRWESGFTYGVHGWLEARRDGGLCSVSGDVERAHVAEAVVQILNAYAKRTKEAFEESELARTKDVLGHVIPAQLDTAEGTAGWIADLVVRKLPMSEMTDWPARTERVTSAAVLAAAQRWAEASREQVVVVATEPQALKRDLTALGYEVVVRPPPR